MKTGWPRACDSGGAMIRPTTSSAPPGGKVATTRTGLAGYWASAAAPSSAPRMPTRVRTRRMLPTPSLLYFLEDQGSDAHLPVFRPRGGRRREHYPVADPSDLPAQSHARKYLVPRDIDMMFDGHPVECVRPAIGSHCAEQVSALLIGHFLKAFRLRP